MKEKILRKSFLWGRIWSIIGIVHLIVIGPYFLEFTTHETVSLWKAGGIAAILLFLLRAFVEYAYVSPIRHFLENEEYRKTQKLSILKRSSRLFHYLFYSSIISFTFGTLIVVLLLWSQHILSTSKDELSFT